jgi:hypothetical protein
VVVTPFIRASSGGADAFARRRIHPSSTSRDASTRAKHRSTRAREMAFSERHAARATGNAAIAGALLTFCGAAYWYTVMKVRKDEMDVAIERREAKAKGAR